MCNIRKYIPTKESVKKNIRIFFNIGFLAIVFSLLLFHDMMTLVPSSEVECVGKIILVTMAGISLVFSVVGWDIISGINIIEQKVKELEKRTGNQDGDIGGGFTRPDE